MISIDINPGMDTIPALETYRTDKGITWTVALDVGLTVSTTYGVSAAPWTFIIDTAGKYQKDIEGLTTSADLIAEIQKWMLPGGLVTDLNHDGVVNVVDLTIVAKAFDTKPGDSRWNSVADLNNDDVINIQDITKVAKDFGKIA